MAFKNSQCLFVPKLFSTSNIARNTNYKLSVLRFTTTIDLTWEVHGTFFPFTENTDEISGHSLWALRGNADVWGGFGGRPPLSRPLFEGTFCPAVGLQLLGKGRHLSQS